MPSTTTADRDKEIDHARDEQVVGRIAEAARARGLSLAVAESLTTGRISSLLGVG